MRDHAGAHRRIASVLLSAAVALGAMMALGLSAAHAVGLPDGRAYELVTPLDKNGLEVGPGVPSINGDALDWEAPGGCCGATSASQTLYQSSRGAGGWQTKALTPAPNQPLLGLTEEQAPMFWTADLSQTIFQTPLSFAAGDERPRGSGAMDLYLQRPDGSLDWLSQGPFAGSGSAPDSATFDGATSDLSHVIFSSAAQLTPGADGLLPVSDMPSQFLYDRDVAAGTTQPVNVANTTLTAPTRGQSATSLTAAVLGTLHTTLSAGAGPGVATTVAAAATGHVSSALSAPAAAGESSIAVASTAGFAPNQQIAIDTGEEAESATIEAVTNATHLQLSAGLTFNHAAGATVAYGGDATLAVASTEGLAAGEQIAIDSGGAEETATIAVVLDPTDLMLSAGLAKDHAAGASVTHAADSSIAVASTEGLSAGESISIGGETAQIAAVTDATDLALSAPLTSPQSVGTAVERVGDTTLALASSAGLQAGDALALDSGEAQETVQIATVPDGTHVTLGAPLVYSHAAGAAVQFAGSTTLTVASTSNFFFHPDVYVGNELRTWPKQTITIGSGSSADTVEVTGVIDATHLQVPGLVHAEPEGSTVIGATNVSGAVLGNGDYLDHPSMPANTTGTTTNAVSDDGSKIFFESPPPYVAGALENSRPENASHLYMRDESTGTTTALDDPESYGWAHFEGASPDGSLVFFTSVEALAGEPGGTLEGEPGDEELYEFNTTDHQIGSAPAMSAIPISGGATGSFLDGRVLGVTAIANDGSHVYFVGEGVLAGNANAAGQTAKVHEPNLYVFDTASGTTTFVAMLAYPDVNDCKPNCTQEDPGINDPHDGYTGASDGLVAEPDVSRPAVTTPDGSVLVFDSSGNLTGQDPGPATTLSAAVSTGEHTLAVASTKGFAVGHTITIGAGVGEEIDVIEAIPDATHLVLSEYGPAGLDGVVVPHAAGDAVTQLHSELYRYDASGGSLTCISCAPAGVTPTGSATLGDAGGGSYGPPMTAVPMNESGTEIFFQSSDPLVPEATNTGSFANGPFGSLTEPTNVYEWENGKVSLISDGSSTAGATLDGTTPSGNDVFLTTSASLLGSDTDGFNDIYDARVGGGFPEQAGPPAPCSGSGCRPGGGASVFFSVPGSSSVTGQGNLKPQSVAGPSFTVAAISAAQRAKSANSGKLTLSVSATAAGKISASVFAKLHGKLQRAGSASVTLGKAGKQTLTLHLSSAARKALAKNGKLALRIEVSYSASGTVKVTTLTLSRGRAKKASTSARGSAASLPTHHGPVRGA